jgi:hypothetical protein
LAFIDELLSKDKVTEYYITPSTYEFKQNPTMGDILVDIEGHEHFFHGITMTREDKVNAIQFLRGWAHMGDNGDPLRHIPYVAMDVRCNSEAGLLGCMQGLPRELCQPGIMMSRMDDGEAFSLMNIVTPAYTISRPHQDGCGRGQVLLAAYGTKLVLWYEESEEIRRLFAELHTSSKGDYMWSAIADWPGLRWTILTPGKYIIMGPGTIHADISPENSTVCGWYFQDKESLLDGSYGKMLNWELDLIEKRIDTVKESEGDPSLNLDLIAVEMEDWKRWLDMGDLDRDSKRELKKLKKQIEDRILELAKRI